jgi:hypothetical protein
MQPCLLAMLTMTSASGQDPRYPNTLDEPATLTATFDGYGESSISDVRLRGSARNVDYSIAAARTEARVIFDITLAGRSVQLRLRQKAFPDIDLRTIREGVVRDSGLHILTFDVEFSEFGGCFASAKTPRRLLISFDVRGRISLSKLIAEGCEQSWHRLKLVRTAPATYSATVQD